jgi:Protein of unknown function (DUF2778)
MSVGTEWRSYSTAHGYDYPAPSVRPQRIVGGATLAGVVLLCGWTACVNLAGNGGGWVDAGATALDQAAAAGTRGDKLAVRGDKLAVIRRFLPAMIGGTAKNADAADDVSLFDARYTAGFPAATFAERTELPLAGRFVAFAPQQTAAPARAVAQAAAPAPRGAHAAQSAQVAQAVPLPQPRIAPVRVATVRDRPRDTTADKPTLFERLFGRSQPSPVTLAYADADTGSLGIGQNSATGLYDRSTAVYDIAARVVYMPDGTRLEAHSGLGSMLDDPHHADVRDRGVTPPDIYDLREREASFHGVRALRLIPEDESKVYGRSGLLAHSFMLGPNGDSNGCVSFRNYEAFLQAYLSHKITRLAVVSHLD